MSALATQLAKNASLNVELLADRSRRKPAESYLFTGSAADHDLESIHALGVNGLLQLALLEPSLHKLEDNLFSEYAKSTDRTLLSAEMNAELDASISAMLALLGPYVMEAPTGRVLEWLVRRFRINEFNVEAILSLFLPYHETVHFTKMLSILHIKHNSAWSFLLPFKSAAQNLPRMSLVKEMLKNTEIARFVTSLLPSAIQEERSHHVLLAFNAACLHDFIIRSENLDEGTVAYLLPALLEPLQYQPAVKDAILGSYILLAALSQKCRIIPAAVNVIISAMSGCVAHVLPRQFFNAMLSVCEPQEEVDQFSKETVLTIIRILNIENEIQHACIWVGVEKVFNPLITDLVEHIDDEESYALLDSIITTPQVPLPVLQRIALWLIRKAVVLKDSSTKATLARRSLGVIQQHHPFIFQKAMDTVSQEGFGRGVGRLRLSLTIGMGTNISSADNVDAVLASMSADPRVRALAVSQLLEQLSQKESMSSTEIESVHSALLARAEDTDQAVVDALYSQPQMVLPVISADAQTYVTNLTNILFVPDAKPKRSLLRAHLKFLITHFYPANASQQDNIFQQIVFPFLLFSKGRQHTAEAVWEIITSSSATSSHEWINGCIPIVTSPEGKDLSSDVEKMANLDTLIASQIARNIEQSKDYSTHLDTLISRMSDVNPHAKILSCLIVRALLTQLSGVDRIEAAHRLIGKIVAGDLEELGRAEDQLPGRKTYQYDAALARAVVTKPGSRSTLQMLQLAIIAAMPSIPRPDNTVLNWLGDPSQVSMDDQGARYVELNRKIYGLANVSGSVPLFTTEVLQSIFGYIGRDTLAFLAGIWIAPAKGVEQSELQVLALHHASAFLQARVLEDDKVDFQTILPSLLVALQSHHTDQRAVAMKCIYHLRQLADRRFTSLYGFDTLYGVNQNELQYLERGDLRVYINDLVEHTDHLVRDADYLKIFHQLHLSKDGADKKRNSQYRRRLLCYLVSHVNVVAYPSAQVILLKSIESISNSAKAETLLPTIKSLVSSVVNTSTKTSQELLELVIACFDLSVATIFNDGQESLWDVFTSIIRIVYSPSATPTSRNNLSRALENGLFAALSFERKVTLCELLLDLGASDADTSLVCKRLLSPLVEDVPLITHILDSLLPAHSPGTPRVAKRVKMAHTPENALLQLSLFAEILGARSLPGSLDLISHLLEALNRLVSSSQADLSYIEQLFMSAVENTANKVIEIPNLSPSVVRLDVLVDVIRVADNPQTFHQALLLMANLARLVPESVLHHAMPIFTFMGSNVFHRDDAYSFKVVQQAIDSIVPVMASSLKRLYSQPFDLYIAAKGFLSVFTDAAHHIPRHRRTNFFVHLVDVLGPGEFLPPVCMLLVDKVSNRVLKQSNEEIRSSFALPVSVLQHYGPSLQITTLASILQESRRLADRLFRPDVTAPTFLEVSNDGEPTPTLSSIFRRRAQALVLFVECAIKPSTFGSTPSDGGLKELVSALIVLSTPPDRTSGDEKADDIWQTAQRCLHKVLGVITASGFINGILSMLESGDKQVQAGALELLSGRLEQVSSEARVAAAPLVVEIINLVRNLLSSKIDERLALSSFKALRSIGLTLCPGEETAITEAIPFIISYIKERVVTAAAILTLSSLPARIGPRIIPHFREIVAQCIAIIREDLDSATTGAINVLHSLLSSLPAFWGIDELTQVVVLYVDNYASASKPSSPAVSNLMKTVAKRGPANVLLPALLEVWPTLKVVPQKERLLPYFDFLSRSFRSASRSDVLEHLRPIFKLFLESFELPKDPGREVEAQVISAFRSLVVNLNEATFRPLFRRLYDWAFANNGPNDIDDETRKITFCHVYIALLDFFKGLMTPYMSFMLTPLVELLQTFGSGTRDNQLLWIGVTNMLTKSLSYDDEAFWRDDRLRHITPSLVQQVPICVAFDTTEGKSSLQDCLLALVDNVTDDMLLKSINLDILMYTRAEDVRLRLFAMTCSEKLWTAHGGKLLGFATEVATFIAECTEDDNDMVVRESFKLKDAVESVAGNINGL